jgi:hypothetical protein
MLGTPSRTRVLELAEHWRDNDDEPPVGGSCLK